MKVGILARWATFASAVTCAAKGRKVDVPDQLEQPALVVDQQHDGVVGVDHPFVGFGHGFLLATCQFSKTWVPWYGTASIICCVNSWQPVKDTEGHWLSRRIISRCRLIDKCDRGEINLHIPRYVMDVRRYCCEVMAHPHVSVLPLPGGAGGRVLACSVQEIRTTMPIITPLMAAPLAPTATSQAGPSARMMFERESKADARLCCYASP